MKNDETVRNYETVNGNKMISVGGDKDSDGKPRYRNKLPEVKEDSKRLAADVVFTVTRVGE